MAHSVHNVAKLGFGQGTNELYDRARPSYPSAPLAAIRSHLRTSPPFKVLELGSGTGLFSRAFLAHEAFSNSVEELKAIEPSEGMRSVFSKQTTDPRASTYPGTFESTGYPDATADMCIVAQAWHWCPDFDAAMKEIARILKPGGIAFFIWNLENRDAADWVKNLREVYEKYEADTPQYRLNLWRETFNTESYKTFFETPLEEHWKHTIPTTRQGVVERVFSKSYITQLSDVEREKLKEEIIEIVERDNKKEWIAQQQGIFAYPYTTTLITMKKV